MPKSMTRFAALAAALILTAPACIPAKEKEESSKAAAKESMEVMDSADKKGLGVFGPNPLLAVVNGKELRFNDVRDRTINDLLVQLHDRINEVLPGIAVQELAKANKDYDAVPKLEVKDEDVYQFYVENNLKARGSLTDLGPRIKQVLEAQKFVEAMTEQFERAKAEGLVVSHLAPPEELLVEANVETAFLRGKKDSRVILVEFSDCQCPYCSRFQTTIGQLIEEYGDRVAFGYRHFPLQFHKEADEAAIAAECARQQGKFEEMHEVLYDRQRNQHIVDLKKYARMIKVPDLKEFDSCLDQDRFRAQVNHDMRVGSSIGVTGTPGFLIGMHDPKTGEIKGELLSGAQPKSVFVKLLDKYLARQS